MVETHLTQEEINNIRSSVNIVEVISDYIPLVKKGKNYFGVCPFHSDHSPSMSVSEERQIYKCFSCGAAGNVFNFLMNYENISFLEAVKIVADKAGIVVDINTKVKNNINNNFKDLYEIFEISQMFYTNNINTKFGNLAKEYLKKRDIDNDIIKEFGIGLALKDRTNLTKLLEKKGYKENTLLKTGLINKNNLTLNDVYYNRIMFPLWDITGHIVGYSGRIYNSEDTAKYINTKETDIFKKGELLYNYHKAKDEARKKDQIIIVEGFMDVIRCYTIGIKNVVATMGTAITEKQALLMKRLAKNIVLCFDGDSAGAKATMNCIEELHKIGITPKIVRLENNLDPDEYIRTRGSKDFILKLDNPINIMDFKLSYLKHDKNLNDNLEISNYLNQMLKEISKIDDDILKELTLNKLSTEYKIDINILKNKLTTFEEESIPKEKPKIKEKIMPKNKYTKAEQNLLYYMLDNEEVVKIYTKNVVYLPNEKYRTLAREITYFYKQNGYINIADIMTFVNNDNSLLETINKIISLDLKEEYSTEEIKDYINTIKDYNKKNEENRLKEKIRMEIDPIKKAALAQKIVEIKQMK